MTLLRWTVIMTLLLGLPTLAVLGDVQQVTGLFAQAAPSHASVTTSKLIPPGDTPLDMDRPEPNPSSDQPLAVYPNLKEPEVETAGKSLRSAIYRPFAADAAPPIVRVPAELRSAPEVVTTSIKELEGELRAMGAQNYRMDDVNGTFIFSCEFGPRTSSERNVVFESQSSTGEAAMRDAIHQARAWQSNLR